MEISELYEVYKSCGYRVTTDSRAVAGGELFIALKGENFDGNAYASKALELGAARAVVSADSQAAATGDPRMIAVEDTFIALRDLARWHREHFLVDGKPITVIGLTGTNGKTTTKELVREVLSRKFNVTATEGNLNNDIGVPLSILKIRPGTQLAVIEMGASHPDDIGKLTSVSEPDYGIITNVGKAHLLGFGSLEGVKKAKGMLYDWLAGHGGKAFVNVDDEILSGMAAARKGMETRGYGVEFWRGIVLPSDQSHPYVRFAVPMNAGLVPEEELSEDLLACETHLVGSYNVNNALAAIAVGLEFGVPMEEALDAISRYEPKNNRSQMVNTGSNVLIVDAYNANPTSMSAALDNFEASSASSKLALLGMMGELGDDSAAEHAAIVRRLMSEDFPSVLVGGEFRNAIDSVGGKALDIKWFPDSEALAAYLKENPVKDTLVLVKGSRSQAMEKVIPVL